jgi:hypothetical protein
MSVQQFVQSTNNTKAVLLHPCPQTLHPRQVRTVLVCPSVLPVHLDYFDLLSKICTLGRLMNHQ